MTPPHVQSVYKFWHCPMNIMWFTSGFLVQEVFYFIQTIFITISTCSKQANKFHFNSLTWATPYHFNYLLVFLEARPRHICRQFCKTIWHWPISWIWRSTRISCLQLVKQILLYRNSTRNDCEIIFWSDWVLTYMVLVGCSFFPWLNYLWPPTCRLSVISFTQLNNGARKSICDQTLLWEAKVNL